MLNGKRKVLRPPRGGVLPEPLQRGQSAPAPAQELGGDLSAPRLRVEIAADKLLELLRARRICASELRCLDCESKSCLWRLCLNAIVGTTTGSG
jgi:hypothetical protein